MLALLDLRLPDGGGLDLLRDWRSAGRTWPVIVLTALDQVSDRVRGLQAAADDYLVKPFDLDELLARINAVVRRVPGTLPGPGTVSASGFTGSANPPGQWQLDLDAHSAWRGGERLDLTPMEWAVLARLAQRRGRIYSRDDIDDRLELTVATDAASNSMDVIISRLRKKLGVEAISTHRGLGYRLES